jgi:hypothetical protein
MHVTHVTLCDRRNATRASSIWVRPTQMICIAYACMMHEHDARPWATQGRTHTLQVMHVSQFIAGGLRGAAPAVMHERHLFEKGTQP